MNMKRKRMLSVATSIIFLFVSLLHTPVSAQVGTLGEVSKEPVGILPPQWSMSRITGEASDSATLAQHFGDPSTQTAFYNLLAQLGYQPMQDQAVFISSNEGSVFALPLTKNGKIQSPIEIALNLRISGQNSTLLYQIYFDSTTHSLIKEVMVDPLTNFGVETDFATGVVSKLNLEAGAAASILGFLQCFFDKILDFAVSPACTISKAAINVVKAAILVAILDNPITAAGVVASIVAAIASKIVCVGFECATDGGGQTCNPGSTKSCTTSGGCPGQQVCNSSGTGFDSCAPVGTHLECGGRRGRSCVSVQNTDTSCRDTCTSSRQCR